MTLFKKLFSPIGILLWLIAVFLFATDRMLFGGIIGVIASLVAMLLTYQKFVSSRENDQTASFSKNMMWASLFSETLFLLIFLVVTVTNL